MKQFTVSMSCRAFDELKDIARCLSISEEAVMRHGLVFMRLYADVQQNKNMKIIFEKDGVQQELTLED